MLVALRLPRMESVGFVERPAVAFPQQWADLEVDEADFLRELAAQCLRVGLPFLATATGDATSCRATVSIDAPARSNRSAACRCSTVRTVGEVASYSAWEPTD